jgi:hypothetical protein
MVSDAYYDIEIDSVWKNTLDLTSMKERYSMGIVIVAVGSMSRID